MNEPTCAPLEPLNEALERLRLEGAIYLRAEYSERWALADPGGPVFAAMMHPGAERLIVFHVVASGCCWVSTPGGARHWASAGEVIVLPYGDASVMGGTEPVEPVSILSVVPPPPWTEMPIVRHGEGGARTDVVCGFLYSDDPLFDPALKVFPTAFVVRPPPGPARAWFDASIAYALEESGQRRRIRSTRLPELLLIEVLRLQLANAPASERGWLAAVRDPLLAPAMRAIHTAPERKWTVDDLAKEAAVSRSLLDGRFRDVLGLSPIRYVNEWRMRVAQDLLATTDVKVAAIAGRVGYDSEEAFSRAFKRAHGQSPSLWRAGRSADSSSAGAHEDQSAIKNLAEADSGAPRPLEGRTCRALLDDQPSRERRPSARIDTLLRVASALDCDLVLELRAPRKPSRDCSGDERALQSPRVLVSPGAGPRSG